MSVNWYLGNGEFRTIDHRQPLTPPCNKTLASQGVKLDPKVSHDQVKNAYHNGQKTSENSDTEESHSVRAFQIMSHPVVKLQSDTSIKAALEIIKTYHYHHFPVIDENEKLIGIATARDFLRQSFHLDHHQENNTPVAPETVASIMSNKVLIAREKTKVSELSRIMLDHHIDSLPVLDQSSKVVGIITRSDLIKSLVKHPITDLIG